MERAVDIVHFVQSIDPVVVWHALFIGALFALDRFFYVTEKKAAQYTVDAIIVIYVIVLLTYGDLFGALTG